MRTLVRKSVPRAFHLRCACRGWGNAAERLQLQRRFWRLLGSHPTSQVMCCAPQALLRSFCHATYLPLDVRTPSRSMSTPGRCKTIVSPWKGVGTSPPVGSRVSAGLTAIVFVWMSKVCEIMITARTNYVEGNAGVLCLEFCCASGETGLRRSKLGTVFF